MSEEENKSDVAKIDVTGQYNSLKAMRRSIASFVEKNMKESQRLIELDETGKLVEAVQDELVQKASERIPSHQLQTFVDLLHRVDLRTEDGVKAFSEFGALIDETYGTESSNGQKSLEALNEIEQRGVPLSDEDKKKLEEIGQENRNNSKRLMEKFSGPGGAIRDGSELERAMRMRGKPATSV